VKSLPSTGLVTQRRPPAPLRTRAGGFLVQRVLVQRVLVLRVLVQRVANGAPPRGRDFVVVCFAKLEDAEAFAKRFGGEQFQAGAIEGQQ
jgi:hypothetical protein